MMVASLIACYTPVSTASTMSDLKKENQKVQQEKTELSGSINELQAQIDAETQSLAVLESTIAENEANYAAAEEDLKETKTDIKQRQTGLPAGHMQPGKQMFPFFMATKQKPQHIVSWILKDTICCDCLA